MRGPFRRRGDSIEVRLSTEERRLIEMVPGILDSVDMGSTDPEAVRLRYEPHPGDPDAAETYRDLIGSDLEDSRRRDRHTLTASLDEGSLDPEQAEAWMRAIGEARLVLAARLGITEDGWEETIDVATDPEAGVLTFFAYIQDALVGALH